MHVMYVYLYDPALKEKRFQSIMKTVENRLTDFGITGRIIRLTPFTNAKPIIEDEVARGSKTFVIVGNDTTFGHIMSSSAALPVTFGYIPVGDDSAVAHSLGIPLNAPAVDVLSARKIEPLDIGWMNNRYFISRIEIEPAPLSVEYDAQFRVRARDGEMGVTICNLLPFQGAHLGARDHVVHPQDVQLDAFLEPVEKKRWFRKRVTTQAASIFPFREMVIRGRRPFTVVADGRHSKEILLSIKLADVKLKMVVGKERMFGLS